MGEAGAGCIVLISEATELHVDWTSLRRKEPNVTSYLELRVFMRGDKLKNESCELVFSRGLDISWNVYFIKVSILMNAVS